MGPRGRHCLHPGNPARLSKVIFPRHLSDAHTSKHSRSPIFCRYVDHHMAPSVWWINCRPSLSKLCGVTFIVSLTNLPLRLTVSYLKFSFRVSHLQICSRSDDDTHNCYFWSLSRLMRKQNHQDRWLYFLAQHSRAHNSCSIGANPRSNACLYCKYNFI